MKAGWQIRELGELCNVIGGGTPPKDNAAYYSGDIPWATVRDMRQEVITSTEYRITRDAVKNSATNIIPAGNVVIATRVGLGKVCLLGQDTAINQDLRGIVPRYSDALSVRFLFWWFKSISDVIEAEGTGATVQGVKLPFVKALPLPVPSFSEQQRIVAILDEALDGIATAKANAERNLQNARALFESCLEATFAETKKGWVKKKLGGLVSFRNGINYTKDSKGESIKVVGVRNFQNNFYAPLDDLDSVQIDGLLSDVDYLRKNDILTVRSNGNIDLIGRCILVDDEVVEKTSHSGFTIRIRLSSGELLPSYLCHFMKSASSRRLLSDGGTGTNIKSLNQGMLASVVVPFPSLPEQAVLVKKLDALSEETQRLESIYRQKLTALDDLKKSLLHQAFTGQL